MEGAMSVASWATMPSLSHRLNPSHGRSEEAQQADERPEQGERRLRGEAGGGC